MRCLFLLPFIAIMALLLLLVPTTHTEGPVYLLPVIRRVRRRYTPSPRHQHGNKRGPTPNGYQMWRPCLFLLYIACFFHTPTALDTGVPSRYHRALVSIAMVTSPHNTRYNNNWVLQCGDVHPKPRTPKDIPGPARLPGRAGTPRPATRHRGIRTAPGGQHKSTVRQPRRHDHRKGPRHETGHLEHTRSTRFCLPIALGQCSPPDQSVPYRPPRHSRI